ncbi:MAG: hypothetical protein R3B82_13285 [Sandaracinaceae bacterium]
MRASDHLHGHRRALPGPPRAYPDALYYLGDSLYRAGDYLGARTRFRELIAHAGDTRYRDHLQRALSRLIEIAIHLGTSTVSRATSPR